jgi:MFS family permease
MLYAGAIADKIHRRKILLMTQVSMMVLSFILAILTFMHLILPWHILVLAFLLGVANAFDAPARQAFVLDMVKKEHLSNAVSLNSTIFNAAMVIGPAVAGITYALFGPGWCFLLNALSFIAVIIGLMMMRFEESSILKKKTTIIEDLKEVKDYLHKNPRIGILIAQVGIMTLFVVSFGTLLPAWAVETLKGDATTNGLLQTARGAGALFVALWIASHGNFQLKTIKVTTFLLPCLLILFAFARSFHISLLLLFIVGGVSVLLINTVNVLVQSSTEDKFRGRVMGVYMLIYFGLMPLGSLWVGFAAENIGISNSIIVGAACAIFCSALVWRLNSK